MARIHPTLLAIIAVPALLSGCAQEAVTGKAAPSGTLNLPPAADVVPAAQWPNACEFLTDGEVAALLPNQQGIERNPRPVEVLGDGTANNGSCEYKASHGNDTWVTINVSIETLASPDIVREQFRSDKNQSMEMGDEVTPAPDDLGAEECFVEQGSTGDQSLHCRESSIQFEVRTMGYAKVPGVDEDQRNKALNQRLSPEVVKTISAKLP